MFKIDYYVLRGIYMKKVLLILTALLIFSTPSFAELTTDEAISPSYILNHGYSKETARIMSLQHAQVNGTSPKYKGSDPEWYESNKAVKLVRDVFIYFDPGLDNGRFGTDDIDYTNKYDDI